MNIQGNNSTHNGSPKKHSANPIISVNEPKTKILLRHLHGRLKLRDPDILLVGRAKEPLHRCESRQQSVCQPGCQDRARQELLHILGIYFMDLL